jgi:hypothetical protein
LIISTIADPTTTASENSANLATSSGVLMPNPTAIGMFEMDLNFVRASFTGERSGLAEPVIPAIVT